MKRLSPVLMLVVGLIVGIVFVYSCGSSGGSGSGSAAEAGVTVDPSNIRSFLFTAVSDTPNVSWQPSTTNAFIITDIVVPGDAATVHNVQVVGKYDGPSFSFESGLVIPAGGSIQVTSSTATTVTVSGYIVP